MMDGRVLIVAGSDSGGGAGIQADIKTVTALEGFAMTAVSALTAQNTLGVDAVHAVPGDFVEAQIAAVMRDIGADAVKTGMLPTAAVVNTVADALAQWCGSVPWVVDPVMVAQSGQRLAEDEAVGAIRDRLLPGAAVVTPNLPEAEVLLGRRLTSTEDVEAGAMELLGFGCPAVVLKGGHRSYDPVTDILATQEGIERLQYPRIDTRAGHGTGCTLASAIATGLAQGLSMSRAVARARAYLQRALQTAPDYGQGSAPLNHCHTVGAFDGSGLP